MRECQEYSEGGGGLGNVENALRNVAHVRMQENMTCWKDLVLESLYVGPPTLNPISPKRTPEPLNPQKPLTRKPSAPKASNLTV